MKKLFFNTDMLDKRCIDEFGISEWILQENAAAKIEQVIRKNLPTNSKVLVMAGGGNNGADGIAVARRIYLDYNIDLMLVSNNLNFMASNQLNIAKKVGVNLVGKESLKGYNCYVDAIFGSGLNKELSNEILEILEIINAQKALKIAIDFPSGVEKTGIIRKTAFKACLTVSTGALNLGLFLDQAKDFVGKIKLANLGISSLKFSELETQYFLLEKSDMVLPFRNIQNSNKGNYGHLYVVSGDMKGASEICAIAANAIGVGLVSIVSDERVINPILMQKRSFEQAKFIVAGCGLGNKELNLSELTNKICVIDADLCYDKNVIELLKNNHNIVITPHPKEFVNLLKLANIANVSVSQLQDRRFELAKEWSLKFDSVLVLKGANTIIAYRGKLYISNFGLNALAKGGSGDVLSGFIGGLLAQGYDILDAAITGVLAHALSGAKFSKNSYALNPLDIIEGVKSL